MDSIDEDRRLERLPRVTPEIAKNFENWVDKNQWQGTMHHIYSGQLLKVHSNLPNNMDAWRTYYMLEPGKLDSFTPAVRIRFIREQQEVLAGGDNDRWLVKNIEIRGESGLQVQTVTFLRKGDGLINYKGDFGNERTVLSVDFEEGEGYVFGSLITGYNPGGQQAQFYFIGEMRRLKYGEEETQEDGNTKLRILREKTKIILQVLTFGETRDIIELPINFDYYRIVDRLVMPKTLEDPMNASPVYDKSWKRDLKPALGINWVILK